MAVSSEILGLGAGRSMQASGQACILSGQIPQWGESLASGVRGYPEPDSGQGSSPWGLRCSL